MKTYKTYKNSLPQENKKILFTVKFHGELFIEYGSYRGDEGFYSNSTDTYWQFTNGQVIDWVYEEDIEWNKIVEDKPIKDKNYKSREETVIKELKPTDEQMRAAMKRASENNRTWVIWKDPKAPKER